MSLFIASLNSGSNGNCYYAGNETEAVLIDVGIACREVEKRMKRLGLSLQKVKAIFVTHEHGDHIHGVPGLAKKYKLPVYITPLTLRNSSLRLPDHQVHTFAAYKAIAIGGLTVTPFPKHHDADDPHSFVVSHEAVRVGVFTDIGFPCRHVIYHFQQCHAAFLETNYDVDMLENGSYPLALKNRIRRGKGHLSNIQALRLFNEHRPPHMSHLILSHLSQNNNKPSLVEELFASHAENTKIIVASRSRETQVFRIDALPSTSSFPPRPGHYQQLQLFS